MQAHGLTAQLMGHKLIADLFIKSHTEGEERWSLSKNRRKIRKHIRPAWTVKQTIAN